MVFMTAKLQLFRRQSAGISGFFLTLRLIKMKFKILHIQETDSTNDWLKTHAAEEDMAVVADHQTAGRGCGDNAWESERGKNLLFSVCYHPQHIPAEAQFVLSMANALALKSVLDTYVGDISIKWPNDIYWQDKKLCGTLIETALQGRRIRRCIIGTGINVNQLAFRGSAPNPVSLREILGHEVDKEELLAKVMNAMTHHFEQAEQGAFGDIREAYQKALYRLHEPHRYRMASDGRTVRAVLTGVSDDGRLQLHLLDQPEAAAASAVLSLAFKEVSFII